MLPLFYVRPEKIAPAGGNPPAREWCSDWRRIARPMSFSLVFHLALAISLIIATQPAEKPVDAVKIDVVRVIPPRPEEPRPKKKPPEKKRVATERSVPPKTPETAPVQGIPPDAVTPEASGIAAPIGNTLLTGDEGKRIKPEDFKPMAGDLSADARLILGSVKVPAYTDAALEANLEGNFIVDVFVDESGNVLQADVRKKVGFGMDERILEAARLAKFTPRKNKFGRAEEGWAEIKFTLVIP